MRPRLVACYFTQRNDVVDMWTRMARVLASTAARHCTGWDVSVARITPASMTGVVLGTAAIANTQKLMYWAAAAMGAEDGTPLLLIDSDTFILRPLDDVFSRPFDIAYTVREDAAGNYPLNAGVVFLRVSDRVRRFVELWRDENQMMLADAAYHRPWHRKYGGINQAALGKVLESGAVEELGLDVAQLPCWEWNCEDTSWTSFDPAVTRILHIKSALRRSVFALGPTVPRLKPLVRLWRETERDAGATA